LPATSGSVLCARPKIRGPLKKGSQMARRRIRILRGDVLVVALPVGAAGAAYAHWPKKAVADIAVTMAALVAFVSWRLR
jgi:hypothetical protein